MQDKDNLTKEERTIEFIKEMDTCLKQIEPYKEHMSALKKNYEENGWLSKADQKLIMKAWKLVKDDQNLDELEKMCNLLKDKV